MSISSPLVPNQQALSSSWSGYRSFLTPFESQKAGGGEAAVGMLALQQLFSRHLGVVVKFWTFAVWVLEAGCCSCWVRGGKRSPAFLLVFVVSAG